MLRFQVIPSSPSRTNDFDVPYVQYIQGGPFVFWSFGFGVTWMEWVDLILYLNQESVVLLLDSMH